MIARLILSALLLHPPSPASSFSSNNHHKMSNPSPPPPPPPPPPGPGPPEQTSTPFPFPPTYSFPPFFTPQPNNTTRHSQLQKWSSLIQAWCRHHRIYCLSLIEATDSPLFHNAALRKRVSLGEARAIVDWMARREEDGGGGGRRAEWIDPATKSAAWIWWRRPEEWAAVLVDWVSGSLDGRVRAVLTGSGRRDWTEERGPYRL